MRAITLDPRVRAVLAPLLLFGLALRLWALAWDPPLHPDEYFQYLEPAWWHLTGVGQEPWEFRQGVRSWLLPFYNGAWMALLLKLGVSSSATIGILVKAHWAVVNLSIVLIAFRGGASVSRRLQSALQVDASAPGWEGGLLAAAACAAFPVLVSYAGHTISELPSMLCLIAGLVLTSELLEDDRADTRAHLHKAAWVGLLLATGACLRIANGPLALVAPAWLLISGRLRLLGALLAAGLLPVLAFGLVDLFTWGKFAGSFIGYLKFNLIDGRAADFGVQPRDWYLGVISKRAGFALPLLALPALLGARATWPYLLSATGLIGYLSTQPHKEERFIIAFWPLLLIAAAGSVGGLCARLRQGETPALVRRCAPWTTALWLALVFAGSAKRMHSNDEYAWQHDRLRAAAWTGSQPDLVGMVGDVAYVGGTFWFSKQAPQFMFTPGLVDNPIITHAIVRAGTDDERTALAADFAPIHIVGEYRVLRRR